MHIIKFNDKRPDQWVSTLSFPFTIVLENGEEYKIILSDNKIAAIKPKK